jgi:hypothetical protein
MKKTFLFLSVAFCFVTLTIVAQKEKSSEMGQTTLEELQMSFYDKDSTAGAVVLYEHAHIYLDTESDSETQTE